MKKPRVLSASTLTHDKVRNASGEDLGSIEDLMIDLDHGRVSYAVLSFGGFLGVGDKYFAVPWEALEVDAEDECLVLDETRERLEAAPGFDKNDWPDLADRTFGARIYDYYGTPRYW